MRIKVPVTHYEDIDLDQTQVNDITLKNLYKLFNWGSDYFIRDRQVWTTNEYVTSHRFEMDEKVREATDQDIFVDAMFNQIKSKMGRN